MSQPSSRVQALLTTLSGAKSIEVFNSQAPALVAILGKAPAQRPHALLRILRGMCNGRRVQTVGYGSLLVYLAGDAALPEFSPSAIVSSLLDILPEGERKAGTSATNANFGFLAVISVLASLGREAAVLALRTLKERYRARFIWPARPGMAPALAHALASAAAVAPEEGLAIGREFLVTEKGGGLATPGYLYFVLTAYCFAGRPVQQGPFFSPLFSKADVEAGACPDSYLDTLTLCILTAPVVEKLGVTFREIEDDGRGATQQASRGPEVRVPVHPVAPAFIRYLGQLLAERAESDKLIDFVLTRFVRQARSCYQSNHASVLGFFRSCFRGDSLFCQAGTGDEQNSLDVWRTRLRFYLKIYDGIGWLLKAGCPDLTGDLLAFCGRHPPAAFFLSTRVLDSLAADSALEKDGAEFLSRLLRLLPADSVSEISSRLTSRLAESIRAKNERQAASCLELMAVLVRSHSTDMLSLRPCFMGLAACALTALFYPVDFGAISTQPVYEALLRHYGSDTAMFDEETLRRLRTNFITTLTSLRTDFMLDCLKLFLAAPSFSADLDAGLKATQARLLPARISSLYASRLPMMIDLHRQLEESLETSEIDSQLSRQSGDEEDHAARESAAHFEALMVLLAGIVFLGLTEESILTQLNALKRALDRVSELEYEGAQAEIVGICIILVDCTSTMGRYCAEAAVRSVAVYLEDSAIELLIQPFSEAVDASVRLQQKREQKRERKKAKVAGKRDLGSERAGEGGGDAVDGQNTLEDSEAENHAGGSGSLHDSPPTRPGPPVKPRKNRLRNEPAGSTAGPATSSSEADHRDKREDHEGFDDHQASSEPSAVSDASEAKYESAGPPASSASPALSEPSSSSGSSDSSGSSESTESTEPSDSSELSDSSESSIRIADIPRDQIIVLDMSPARPSTPEGTGVIPDPEYDKILAAAFRAQLIARTSPNLRVSSLSKLIDLIRVLLGELPGRPANWIMLQTLADFVPALHALGIADSKQLAPISERVTKLVSSFTTNRIACESLSFADALVFSGEGDEVSISLLVRPEALMSSISHRGPGSFVAEALYCFIVGQISRLSTQENGDRLRLLAAEALGSPGDDDGARSPAVEELVSECRRTAEAVGRRMVEDVFSHLCCSKHNGLSPGTLQRLNAISHENVTSVVLGLLRDSEDQALTGPPAAGVLASVLPSLFPEGDATARDVLLAFLSWISHYAETHSPLGSADAAKLYGALQKLRRLYASILKRAASTGGADDATAGVSEAISEALRRIPASEKKLRTALEGMMRMQSRPSDGSGRVEQAGRRDSREDGDSGDATGAGDAEPNEVGDSDGSRGPKGQKK